MSIHSKFFIDTDYYDQYLQYIANIDASPKEKYELLYILNAILSHFVDQAFGEQNGGITFQTAENIFVKPAGDDTICTYPENQPISATRDGVERDSNPKGARES